VRKRLGAERKIEGLVEGRKVKEPKTQNKGKKNGSRQRKDGEQDRKAIERLSLEN
jgi:hypothetical protein